MDDGQLGNNGPSSPQLPEACAIHNSEDHAGASNDLRCRPPCYSMLLKVL
jgi:hypothetical protein